MTLGGLSLLGFALPVAAAGACVAGVAAAVGGWHKPSLGFGLGYGFVGGGVAGLLASTLLPAPLTIAVAATAAVWAAVKGVAAGAQVERDERSRPTS